MEFSHQYCALKHLFYKATSSFLYYCLVYFLKMSLNLISKTVDYSRPNEDF